MAPFLLMFQETYSQHFVLDSDTEYFIIRVPHVYQRYNQLRGLAAVC